MVWTCSVDDDFTLTPEQHAEMSAVASNTMSEANALMRDMLAISEHTEMPDLAKVYALGAALQSVVGFMRDNDCDVQDAIAMCMGIIFETYSTPVCVWPDHDDRGAVAHALHHGDAGRVEAGHEPAKG